MSRMCARFSVIQKESGMRKCLRKRLGRIVRKKKKRCDIIKGVLRGQKITADDSHT